MSYKKYLNTKPLFDLIKYKSNVDYSKESINFSGAPRKHPYDTDKLLLVLDPFSSNTLFYEFRIKDIQHVEDLPNIATENGENLRMVKVWIKKGSPGMKYEPFVVEEKLKFIRDSDILHQSEIKKE